MKEIKTFEYNNIPISFQAGEFNMINATQMAKAFGKRPIDFLRLPSTKTLVDSFVRKSHISENQVVRSVRGGNMTGGGTWMHEIIALAFAQWLSPELHIWCLERLRELLHHGITATDDVLEKIQADPEYAKVIARELAAEREKNRQLLAQAEQNAHKVIFYDNVRHLDTQYNKRKTFLIKNIAGELKMNSGALIKFLIRKKFIIRVENGFDLHPSYADKSIGYPKEIFFPLKDSEGNIIYPTQQIVEYTKKGKELILSLIEEGKIKNKSQK